MSHLLTWIYKKKTHNSWTLSGISKLEIRSILLMPYSWYSIYWNCVYFIYSFFDLIVILKLKKKQNKKTNFVESSKLIFIRTFTFISFWYSSLFRTINYTLNECHVRKMKCWFCLLFKLLSECFIYIFFFSFFLAF